MFALMRLFHVFNTLVLLTLFTKLLSESGRLGNLGTISSDLVPRQIKDSIERFERTATGFGQEEVDPAETDEGDAGKEVHCSGGGHANEHLGYSLGVTILVDEVEGHGERATNGTKAQREDFGVDEILDRVPTHGPTEATEVDASDGCFGGSFLASRLNIALLSDGVVDGEEDGHVQHGDELQTDTNAQGTLSADEVDQEESTHDGTDEFDQTENTSCEKLLLLSGGSHQGEVLRSIDRDGVCTAPLTKQLRADSQEDTVEVGRNEQKLTDETKLRGTHGRFLLTLKLAVDVNDLHLNTFVILAEATQSAEVVDGFCLLVSLHEPTRTLNGEEAEDEDDGGEIEVEGVGNDPLDHVLVADVQRGAVRSKVSQHDTQVHASTEDTDAETTDRLGRHFSKIGRCHDSSLTDTQAGNETSSIDHTDASVGGSTEEDSDTSNPDQAKLANSPDSANSIGDRESEECTED